ncbi:MAG: tetratricopeptide repeat protein [Candidatus Marsarchaeota archaeon]|jgi:tetratricopeptide (TPR) repeat protein|nr:tetratricopeptide repeat protein [Candidatus Marsarchaeota archaeon]
MDKEDAIEILLKYTAKYKTGNTPITVQTKEDLENVLAATKIVDRQTATMMENTLALTKSTIESEKSIDYSKVKYKLELSTLSDKENTTLTNFLKDNLSKTAETYGSAVPRMVFGDKIRKPEDVDIQLHVKDENLAENLAQSACDMLNGLSFFNRNKFVVSLHDPMVCLLPAKRYSVVRLKNSNKPILDIHIEDEEGSIPKYEFGYKRFLPVLADGMKITTIAQYQLDKLSSSFMIMLKKTVALSPAHPKRIEALTHLTRGAKALTNEEFEYALEEINKAIELNPNYAVAYNNKSIVLFKLKKYAEAIKAADKALELDPNNAAFIDNKNTLIKLTNKVNEEKDKRGKENSIKKENIK